MDDELILKRLLRRLDILIMLQTEIAGEPAATRPASKIQRLLGLGLSASEIASILGKPINYVTATAYRHKKGGKRKERPNDK
jgi:hypothetical protein